jgi:hypothetical protein
VTARHHHHALKFAWGASCLYNNTRYRKFREKLLKPTVQQQQQQQAKCVRSKHNHLKESPKEGSMILLSVFHRTDALLMSLGHDLHLGCSTNTNIKNLAWGNISKKTSRLSKSTAKVVEFKFLTINTHN